MSTTIERMRWRGSGYQLGSDGDPATIARTFAYLFGFGSFLLAYTLLLPGSPERDSGPLLALAGAALLVAIGFIAGYDRLPPGLLKVAPAMASAMVALVVYFGGPGIPSVAYAMYLPWVVIAAGCFFSRKVTVAHGAIAIGAYALALAALDNDSLIGLKMAMTAGAVGVAAIVISGLSKQMREVMERLEDAANTDPLTQVYNRRAFEAAFDSEISRSIRNGRPCGVLLIDLDGFKAYNDANGHPAGDDALRRIGVALRETTRLIDIVARLGGEEFAVLAPDSDTAGALALAERLRRAIEVEFSGVEPPLTASFGVASYPTDGTERLTLVGAADRALYEAKAIGRNRAIASSERSRSARKRPLGV